jgi:uncharacterized protein YfkK (UPF0435 family)
MAKNKLFIFTLFQFSLWNYCLSQGKIEIKLPIDIKGSEEYAPKQVSNNSRYVLISKNIENTEGNSYVIDLYSEKVIFSKENVIESFLMENEVYFTDNNHYLWKYSLSNGKLSFISRDISNSGKISRNVFYLKKDSLFVGFKLVKVFESEKIKEIFPSNDVLHIFTKDGIYYTTDSTKRVNYIKTLSSDDNSKFRIYGNKILIFTSEKKYIFYDLDSLNEIGNYNYGELGIGDPSEESDVLNDEAFLYFDESIYVKNFSGYHRIFLKKQSDNEKNQEDFGDLYTSAASGQALVEVVRGMEYLVVSNLNKTKFKIKLSEEIASTQLNGVSVLNDSLFFLHSRWGASFLLNINSASIRETDIPSSLKATPSIKMISVDEFNFFYVNNDGYAIFNVNSCISKPFGIRLKKIKLASYEGEYLKMYEFYDWYGPSSPEDLKSIYTIDPKKLSIVNLLEFELEDEKSRKYVDTYDRLEKKNKFSVENMTAHIKAKELEFDLAIDQNNGIMVNNGLYYNVTKSAVKNLIFSLDNRIISFEQLDLVYNRPDIVLDSIGKYFGGADQEMVANYRQSWEKRIDRLGLDKDKLGKGEIAVPNAEIVNADTKTEKAPMIEYSNSSGKTIIHVTASDSKYKLKRYNVYVNEVPVYGSFGRSISQLNTNTWEGLDTIALSQGENKIQVTVMNELGLENFKYPTYVNYTPTNEIIAKTHYIGIGVNAFKDSSHNLKYCKKDVEDLANSFRGTNTEVKLFTDQQVTKENILALKDYLKKTSVNDKVIISCSSHGLLDDSLNFYLAMHDVDFDNPKARGLKYEELESLLDGIPARQKLLLLDACNSGEIEKQLEKETKDDEYLIEKDTSNNKIGRGLIQPKRIKKQAEFQKMNELFVNVRNNTGSVIISAAGGQESALEGDLGKLKINNGAFTYSILEYLEKYKNNKNELTVNKLKQYVEKRVEEITNGKQKPTSRQETMEVDWGVR